MNISRIALYLTMATSTLWSATVETITKADGISTLTAKGFELRITEDGYPSAMRLPASAEESVPSGPNILRSAEGKKNALWLGGERSAYFYQEGLVPLRGVESQGPNRLYSQGEKSSILYDFNAQGMSWTISNKTDRPMQFFILLDRSVNAVMDDLGQIKKTPALQFWPATTWFQGRRKLHITGGDRIWGPQEILSQDSREGHFQVWEATLEANETRIVTFISSFATEEELAAVNYIAPEKSYRNGFMKPLVCSKPAISGDLRIFSPREDQVFQRQTRTRGNLRLEGDLKSDGDKVEYRITGTSLEGPLPGDWRTATLDPVTHRYHALISTPVGGWYQLDVRALQANTEISKASLLRVGIGEVFVIAGESDSTNGGTDKTASTSGMVSCFSGAGWQPARDPLPGAHDTTSGGSSWPSFGDVLYAKLKVPIGLTITGQGGSSVDDWRCGSQNFAWFLRRIQQLHPGGFRAVLWQQGESDSSTPPNEYYESLASLIAESYTSAGWTFPWFVAQTSSLNQSSLIRSAQEKLWTGRIALEGPDTETLKGTDRSGPRLTEKGLKKQGGLWAEKVAAYLNQVLPK